MVRPLIIAFLIAPGLSRAQAPAPASPRPDPLMSLLMSQPRTEISSNVIAAAEFDPPVVRPGESSTYRVTFNALEESIAWPEALKAPSELNLRQGGHGQVMQFGGGGYVPRTCFNSQARVARAGEFILPSFVLEVYGKPVTVPAARLVVTDSPSVQTSPGRRILIELPSTHLFVGQTVRLRAILPSLASGQIQPLTQVQINGEGLLVDQGASQQQVSMVARDGRSLPAYVYETTLTPLKAGKLSVFAQGFTMGNRASGPVILPGGGVMQGGLPQFVLVDSDPVELQVRSLPQAGELPGFTGAIGRLSLDPPRLTTNVVRAGETVKLSVTVHGEGNLSRLTSPPPPVTRDWQIFSGVTETPAAPPLIVQRGGAVPGGAASAVNFVYSLVPLAEGLGATPMIPFCYFDPERAAYQSLPIPSIPVTVKATPTPADLGALRQPDTEPGGAEKEPVLSDLAPAPGLTAASLVPVERRAWFPLVQLAPGLAFAALWGWDRRRRYLELHPEVLLRRGARRALRRERRAMRRAAQAGDAPEFAAAAVKALRVVCAPRYPAHPEALVGADVLALLPAEASAAPPVFDPNDDFPPPPDHRTRTLPDSEDARRAELVRRLFTVTDATRFGAVPADASLLLPREAEIESLLTQLEGRLC